jgi:very-short-patch-repair endonuclease
MAQSGYERRLQLELRAIRLPEPKPQFRFHPTRRWTFDLAWPDRMLAVEVEGGIWTRGRHVRGKGYERDVEKYNAAALLGWKVLRFTTTHVKSGYAVTVIEQAFSGGDGGQLQAG